MKRQIVIGLALLALLAGCATTAPTEPIEPEPSTTGPARPLLTGSAARAEVQKILRHSLDWLSAGEADRAQVELEYAQQLEPDNRQVGCLLRGVTVDPLAALGKASTAYAVRPGESLAQIARRALGDMCEFYLLARYNQIPVPKQLAAGLVIRIPGTVALAPPEAAPAVVGKPEQVTEINVKPAPPPELDVKMKRVLVDNHHRIAQTAYRKHDLTTAIREWDAVLAIDPNNGVARTRRQEALKLQHQLEKLGK